MVMLASDSRRGLAMIMMIISSVVISFGGLIMRSIEDADPFQLNFYRSVGLFSATLVFLLFRYGKQTLPTIKSIGSIGVIGGTLLAIAGLAHLQAMAHTTIANSLFVLGAIPFFSALLARIFLKEKLTRSTLITMIIAALGLAVMVKEGITLGAGFGNLMAVSTALCFACYAVIIRGKRKVEMFPTLLVSSVIILGVSTIATSAQLQISWHDFWLCMLWGGGLSGVANFLFLFAARHLAAAEATLFMLLEFALGPIWVWWLVNEIPSKWTVIGGVIIMFAVVVRAFVELANKPRQAKPVKVGI